MTIERIKPDFLYGEREAVCYWYVRDAVTWRRLALQLLEVVEAEKVG